MNITARGILLAPIPMLLALATAFGEPTEFPIKVSPNGRYFVDSNGAPVFWLGTTQWELFRGYSLEDATTILERTGSHGFTFVQVKLLGQGDGSRGVYDLGGTLVRLLAVEGQTLKCGEPIAEISK
jgi:hypothetical protein